MTTTPQEPTPSHEEAHAPVSDVRDERAGDPTARDDDDQIRADIRNPDADDLSDDSDSPDGDV